MVIAPNLTRMLEARSVAVVGASPRPGSNGDQMMKQLIVGGFEGSIAPVNPNHTEVRGFECYPTLADVPFDIDLALLGVPNHLLEKQLVAAADAGVGGVVIFASGLEEVEVDPPLVARLTDAAREAEIVVCGGNCMGFANFDHRLRALAFEEPEDLAPGGITWITHSGSAFTAFLHNDRGLRFNLAVSAGQEFTTTVADYMAYSIDQRSTKAIALFIETIRDAPGFLAALRTAAERDVPVVCLKVGRNERANTLVAAHSGALAGDDGAFEAVFEAHGVMRVETFNEMLDTLELVIAGRKAHPGGLAAIHDSGGERAHLVDVADRVGVPLAQITDTTTARLADVLEPGLPATNPLDAWGTGNDFDRIFTECAHALIEDPASGAFAFAVDLVGENDDWGYADLVAALYSETDLPLAVMSNLSSAIDPAAARRLRSEGIPVLEGTDTGLRAFGHLFDRRDFVTDRGSARQPATAIDTSRGWLRLLAERAVWTEVEALELVADYGIDTIASATAASLDEAVAAAHRVGWPVALKTASGLQHKTEAQGVVVDLAEEEAFVRAYRKLVHRLGPHVVVQAMAPRGVEIALGVVRDPQFGPLVVVAAGGELVEVLNDRRLGLPPLTPGRARRMIDGLRMRPVLDGVRGRPANDVDSLVDAVVRVSTLAADLGSHFEALDLNPLIVHPEGCVVVDALVVPATQATP